MVILFLGVHENGRKREKKLQMYRYYTFISEYNFHNQRRNTNPSMKAECCFQLFSLYPHSDLWSEIVQAQKCRHLQSWTDSNPKHSIKFHFNSKQICNISV